MPMFPVGDDDTSIRTVPVVSYGLIALNLLLFLAELYGGDEFIRQWAFIPKRFSEDPVREPSDGLHSHVHAWWLDAPLRQHALPVDLRQQC